MGTKKTANGFTKRSTAEQVTEGVNASNLTAFVTGVTSGIGKETVRVLANRGAHVFLAARNVEAAGKVKEEILQETPSARLNIINLDISVLESVRTAAAEFLALNVPLNILINNAGVMMTPFQKTKDGIELQFATNYLGHFLLTQLLLDKMKETAEESGIEGRIINVSSRAHIVMEYKEGIRFEQLNDETGYSRFKAYGQSKLAQILFTMELSKRLQEEGANITVNALHPGTIRTNLGSDVFLVRCIQKIAAVIPLLKTPAQGAATQCYLALNPGAARVTGQYYSDDVNESSSPSKFVKDEQLWTKLYQFSLDLTSSSG